MKIVSIYTVTNYKTGKMEEVIVEGAGQEPIKHLRGLYPKFSKFVLEGFEVDNNFKYVDLR